MSIEQQNHGNIYAELLDQLPDETFAKPQMGQQADPNIDLSAAMQRTLQAPEFYPPLHQSVFPGDSVAIAMQSDLPHAKLVLDALIEQLGSASVAVSDIVVVITQPTADQLGLDRSLYEVNSENRAEGKRPAIFPVQFEFNTINFQVHDPDNPTGHAYLVANEAGDPVHINRILVDADVVLPIGCPAPGEVSQQINCIYPDFSNAATQHRFGQGKGSFVSRWEEIELANDSLGSFFAIQIVQGPGNTIRHIFSGARKDAVASARAATNELWAFHWEKQAEFVVATIETNPDDQNWDDFASAVVAAGEVSDGPIVIWSDIASNPDRNVRKACLSHFEDGINSKLPKTLQRVAAIIKDRPVFLRSALSRNSVEELGLGFVKTATEVLRIAEPHVNGLVIRDAHKCQMRSGANEKDRNDPMSKEIQ